MAISLPGAPARSSLRLLRAFVVFNPAAGAPQDSPYQLVDLLTQLQKEHILPEVHLVMPESNLSRLVQNSLRRGIRLFIVAGGDGTIESMIAPLVGSDAQLAIIPTGTRNNVALALNIPHNIPEAVALIRQGEVRRLDVGHSHCGHANRWFLETASMGLVPALYPSADDVQHGDLTRIGDFLATLITSPQAEFRLVLDDNRVETAVAHVILAANMPYFGRNFQISGDISFQDSWLDVIVFNNLTKLELLTYAIGYSPGGIDDPRILHYRARKVVIQANPRLPVMADGFSLGEGTLTARVEPSALRVISGRVESPGGENEANLRT